MNILVGKVQKWKESKQLIRNLQRKLIYQDHKTRSQKFE